MSRPFASPPSPRSSDPAARRPSVRDLRRVAVILLGLGLVVIGVVATGPAASESFPLDPGSTAGDGLRGLVEVLEDLDVDVAVSAGPPRDISTRIFVPADRMTGDARAEVVAHARDGGTVVVAGPSPGIHGLALQDGSPVDVIGRTARAPACDGLDEVSEVFQNRWTTLEVPPDATACFAGAEGDAWLVASPVGAGTVIALGSARPFTNDLLAEADNAVLAATLLGPAPGDRLVIVPPGEIGEGDTALLELVPGGFFRALALLIAAVIAAVLSRARRLGPPVDERLPPVLPGAELARSVAGLMQRAGNRAAAGGRIRDDVRQEVRRALRLPVDTPSSRLVELVARRSGVTEPDARLVLLDAPIDHDRELTALAAAAARVRAGLRRPSPTAPGSTAP